MRIKKNILLIICLSVCTACFSQPADGPLPSAKQLAWQNAPFYLFMHFGPNTFTDLEWGKGSEKEEIFNPSALDCRQWCRIAKAAGAAGIVITAKHHDGFCLWPSAFSTHTVQQSSWRNGKGDVLKELSAACREYGLSMGVYLSPWDRNHPAYGTPAYNDVFIHMMKEVVSAYGPFFEFWWDGANGEGPNGKKMIYDWHRFESTIRAIAPGAMVFSDIGPDMRWVGNENGIVGTTNWNLLDTAGFSRGAGAPPNDTLNQGNVNGKNWIPAECDVSIRPGWFYHRSEDSLVKSPEKLFTIYLKSIGRGANLILNVPPDPRGLISSFDSAALMGFADLRQKSFQYPLADQDWVITKSGSVETKWNETELAGTNGCQLSDDYTNDRMEIRFANRTEVNCILLKEYLATGQRVKSFTLELFDGDQPVFKHDYTTIGHQRLISFMVKNSTVIRLTVSDAKAPPSITMFRAYHIPDQLVEK